MSTPVSHKGHQIISWPENTVSPAILYLQVGGEIVATAACNVGGWRIFLTDSVPGSSLGANVGDLETALQWLDTLGQLAAVSE